MSKFAIQKINRRDEKDYKKWVNFLEKVDGATIFHHPDFLSYHFDRFDEYHLAIFKGEHIFAIIPLALVEVDGKKIAKSPYGASYGGFVFKKLLSYSESKEIAILFKEFLSNNNIETTYITPSLDFYHKVFSDTFNFAMLEQGFKIINSDITSVVPLKDVDLETEVFTSKLRNVVRKAQKLDINIVYDASIDDFWILMEKTFNKHGVSPTHTKEEIGYLNSKFPKDIYFNIAYLDNTPIAGMGVFKINSLVNMSFYLCSDSNYQQTQALSLLVYDTIKKSQENGFNYFDFGTSSVNMIGKDNIFRFKESFGSIGKFRNTYRLELKDLNE